MIIRVAVAGVGHWHAERHMTALARCGVTFVGVSDHDPITAQRVALNYGATPYTDHCQMLDAGSVDFVVAMPRHDEASTLIRALLNRQLPAIIEKPAGLNADEIAPLAEGAERTGAFLAVPLINRYSPLWQHLDSLADPPIHAHFRIINGPAQRYVDAGCGWMLNPRQSGGGALRNLGIHAADAALMLAAHPIEDCRVIGAELSFSAGLEVDTHAVGIIKVHDTTVIIEAGYTFPLLAAGMNRAGDREWRVATPTSHFIDRDDTLHLVNPQADARLESISDADRYARFIEDTLTCWREDRRPVADLTDCYRAARVVDAIYQHANAPWLRERSTKQEARERV